MFVCYWRVIHFSHILRTKWLLERWCPIHSEKLTGFFWYPRWRTRRGDNCKDMTLSLRKLFHMDLGGEQWRNRRLAKTGKRLLRGHWNDRAMCFLLKVYAVRRLPKRATHEVIFTLRGHYWGAIEMMEQCVFCRQCLQWGDYRKASHEIIFTLRGALSSRWCVLSYQRWKGRGMWRMEMLYRWARVRKDWGEGVVNPCG